jgi:hypothetical protein
MSQEIRNRVDIEHIRYLKEELRKINALDFESIDFYENGKKTYIPPDIRDHWRFIGMTNACFIDTDFYKTGWSYVYHYDDLGNKIRVKVKRPLEEDERD